MSQFLLFVLLLLGSPNPFPDKDFNFIRGLTRNVLKSCKVKAKEGTALYTPDGQGTYKALWTRDFAYMLMYAGDLIDPIEAKNCIRYILRGQRSDGLMPDRVTLEGKAVYSPGAESKPLADHALDNGAFASLCVCAYVNRTGDFVFFKECEGKLKKGLLHTRVSNYGLVYNPPSTPQCPYGFTDTVAKTGHVLFCSLLYYQACKEMARLCERTGHGDVSFYKARAEKISHALPLLMDQKTWMFFAAELDCRQIDIWGSALAAYLGVTNLKQRGKISEYLLRNYHKIVQRGQVRHLPEPELWQRLLVPVASGHYQNGAFWATPVAWVAPVIALKDPVKAMEMVQEVISDFKKRGVYECVNGERVRVRNYAVSATNVYGALKELKHLSRKGVK